MIYLFYKFIKYNLSLVYLMYFKMSVDFFYDINSFKRLRKILKIKFFIYKFMNFNYLVFFFISFLFLWLVFTSFRSTLPRIRLDQLLDFFWKYLIVYALLILLYTVL